MASDTAKHATETMAAGDQLQVRVGFCSQPDGWERNADYAGAFVGDPPQRARFGVAAAIAEGIGGAPGGRVAAELAVRGFIDGHFSQADTAGIRASSARTLEALNRWIQAMSAADPSLQGMSCTFTALVIRGRMGHVLHIGDCRIYRFRDHRLDVMTSDDRAGSRGFHRVLTRALGADEAVRLDYLSMPLRVHDRYLLCTDSVDRRISRAAIRELMGRRHGPDETARALIDAARAAAGHSATALIIDVVTLPSPNRLDLELIMASQPILKVPKSGAVVDDFELCRLLADGRYTRVFLACDRLEPRQVVLKFPKPLAGADALLRQAMLRESWIAARVRSPWVGEVLELTTERKSGLYTVMPYYPGETLETWLTRSSKVTLAGGIDLALKLAKGVAALHRAGIIHRDIKPDNVIVQPSTDHQGAGLKLIDLGVARLPNSDDFPEQHAPGTPSYMAPELFTGAPGDERSDQFALGVTIYRMFCGRYPYGEIEPFSHPRFRRPTSLLTHRPDLPAWLDQCLARAVAIDPQQRFEDVLELIFELEHGAIRGAPVNLRRPPLYERNPVRFWQVVAALLALGLFACLWQISTHRVQDHRVPSWVGK